MIIHKLKSKSALCGAMGSWTGTTRKKDVTCLRCLIIMGKIEPEKKPDLKSGVFVPRDPTRRGASI